MVRDPSWDLDEPFCEPFEDDEATAALARALVPIREPFTPAPGNTQGYTDDDIDRIVAKGMNAEARLAVAVDVVELAEDVARTLLEADGPCPYCRGGWCETCQNEGVGSLGNPCWKCHGDQVPHAADCALDLLFNKARAALGKES